MDIQCPKQNCLTKNRQTATSHPRRKGASPEEKNKKKKKEPLGVSKKSSLKQNMSFAAKVRRI
jgi:hypothetical protein